MYFSCWNLSFIFPFWSLHSTPHLTNLITGKQTVSASLFLFPTLHENGNRKKESSNSEMIVSGSLHSLLWLKSFNLLNVTSLHDVIPFSLFSKLFSRNHKAVHFTALGKSPVLWASFTNTWWENRQNSENGICEEYAWSFLPNWLQMYHFLWRVLLANDLIYFSCWRFWFPCDLFWNLTHLITGKQSIHVTPLVFYALHESVNGNKESSKSEKIASHFPQGLV